MTKKAALTNYFRKFSTLKVLQMSPNMNKCSKQTDKYWQGQLWRPRKETNTTCTVTDDRRYRLAPSQFYSTENHETNAQTPGKQRLSCKTNYWFGKTKRLQFFMFWQSFQILLLNFVWFFFWGQYFVGNRNGPKGKLKPGIKTTLRALSFHLENPLCFSFQTDRITNRSGSFYACVTLTVSQGGSIPGDILQHVRVPWCPRKYMIKRFAENFR